VPKRVLLRAIIGNWRSQRSRVRVSDQTAAVLGHEVDGLA
jgi:hypothetical protein